MKILGIETSCDDTAVAVVEDGTKLLSNVIASQVEHHAPYGGVVPEVAARQHLLQIVPAVKRALEQAEASLDEIDAIAVTHGPGLVGALLVGVNFGKGLALARGLPLVGVNHLEAHIYAAWLTGRDPAVDPGFPLVCLVASGGHTDLFLMERHGRYQPLGGTRDDAAGEAFDKAARLLGLGFPGGPEIQKAATDVITSQKLPRAWLKGSLDFSFSGVKTALLYRLREYKSPPVGELAAAFQESVVEVLATKTIDVAKAHQARGIILGGGVAANVLLREKVIAQSPVPTLIPPPVLCTDNGAMVAACAFLLLQNGYKSDPALDVEPSLGLG